MNELAVLAILVATYWAATELGFHLARRRRKPMDDGDKSHISALQASLLGLLALLLGFSFSMAVSRYDHRKSLLLQEVNSIGTTYLRAGFLAPEQAKEARRLLRAYVDSRLQFVNQNVDDAQVERIYATAGETHDQLWSIATGAMAQDPKSVPTGLFVTSLNETIDLNESRRTAFSNHVPEAVLVLLILVSCGALGFIGYGCGLANHRRALSTFTFIVLSALVLVVILDMDRPRRGLILVNQDAMVRLQASLAKDGP